MTTGDNGWLSGRLSGRLSGGLSGSEILDGEKEQGGLEPIGAMEGGGEGMVGGLVIGVSEGEVIDGDELGVGVVEGEAKGALCHKG